MKDKDKSDISISQNAENSSDVQQFGIVKGDVTISHGSLPDIPLSELLSELFAKLDQWILTQENKYDKEDAQVLVNGIKAEIGKGEQAQEEKFAGLLHRLNRMAPDIWEVVVNTLVNPAAGVATVIQKISEKAGEQSEAQ